ncbi:hypothetical protein OSTOST_08247, partial [Ostertagia ostertagi]
MATNELTMPYKRYIRCGNHQQTTLRHENLASGPVHGFYLLRLGMLRLRFIPHQSMQMEENEKNTCSWDGDEIDFIRMKGSWGQSEGDTIFGKSDQA